MKFVIIFLSKCCFNPLWLSSVCHHSLCGTKDTMKGEWDCAWVSQYAWCMCFREGNGSWPAEDPVSTEERKESSWEEERSRSRSEDCSQSSAGLLMSCLQGETFVWLKLWPKGHWFKFVLWGVTVSQTFLTLIRNVVIPCTDTDARP